MTVSKNVPVNTYPGNNSVTRFDFDFLIEDESELLVQLTDSSGVQNNLTLGVDYSINEIKNKNGSYILYPLSGSVHSVLGSDEKISLSLNLEIFQDKEYVNSGKLSLATLEWSFDYIVRLLQIMSRKIERAAKVPEGSNINSDILVSNINAVVENENNINTVAGNNSNINTVASKINYVENVSNNMNIVTAVYNNEANINAVKNNEANINSVKANATNINTVAGSITNVNNVSKNISNINAVAGNATNINAVKANEANINAVKNNAENINAVNANKSNIDLVAQNNSKINTVANNINDVKSAAIIANELYDVLDGGKGSSRYNTTIDGGAASTTFNAIIDGGNAASIGTVLGDVENEINVIRAIAANNETDIKALQNTLKAALIQINNLSDQLVAAHEQLRILNSYEIIDGGNANSIFS